MVEYVFHESQSPLMHLFFGYWSIQKALFDISKISQTNLIIKATMLRRLCGKHISHQLGSKYLNTIFKAILYMYKL